MGRRRRDLTWRPVGSIRSALAAVDDQQVLEVDLVRIEDVIVGVAVHQYAFCGTVGEADGVPHLVNRDVRPLAAGELTREIYVATRGEATRLDRVEVSVGSVPVSHRHRHTVRAGLAGVDQPGVQTRTSVPGGNTFLHLRDPVSRYVLGLEGDDDLGSPVPSPGNLGIVRILVL